MFKEEVPAVILSGGKSRRMDGNDKAFISIGDQTLLEMIVKRLESQEEWMEMIKHLQRLKIKLC